MKRDTFIVYGEWEDDLEDLDDHEVAELTRAFFAYVRRGEKPTFENEDRMIRKCWRTVQGAEDRAIAAYDEKCEKNRLNGQKGGAPKGNKNAKKQPNNRTVEKTTENNPPNPNPNPNPNPDPDRGRGRNNSPVVSPSADTTTTTALQEQIVQKWNQHDFVQKIKRVDNPQKRWERTEMAIAVAGGQDKFLNILDTLDKQAYLTKQPNEGYRVIYDWLIQPETFQSLIEGKYEKSRDKFGDGWEVVEFG